MKHIVFIGLGSNMGDRQANLRAALHALHPAVQVLAQSPVYETAPWGYTDQPDFLNQVVKAETELTPHALLDSLKSIETALGRTPTFRYGPRPIDLDILLYDDLVLDTTNLTLPHPRLTQRAFVLVPLADLAPDLRPPRSRKTIRQMLAALEAQDVHLYTPGRQQTPESP
jgi:2-amino-4-hydroxy-6-hydroxymethyldihydropteridine diphosphokinase